MVNLKYVEILKNSVRKWNSFRKNQPNAFIDLYKADLYRLDLSGANFDNANLMKADLSYANLTHATFMNADLQEADFSGSILIGANFSGANLIQTSFWKADLSGANFFNAELRRSDLTEANLSGVNLTNADLTQAQLIESNLYQTNIRGCKIFGISAWGVNLKGAIQRDLIITRDEESTITVDDLEVAQFIYLLLYNEKIRKVIDVVTKKVVLILGRFTPERKEVLYAIREKLREFDYLPIMFDFEKPQNRNFIETVSILAHISHFIIADVTEPRLVIEEIPHIVRNIDSVPVIPIVKKGEEKELLSLENLRCNHKSLLNTYEYINVENLLNDLKNEILIPAESWSVLNKRDKKNEG